MVAQKQGFNFGRQQPRNDEKSIEYKGEILYNNDSNLLVSNLIYVNNK